MESIDILLQDQDDNLLNDDLLQNEPNEQEGSQSVDELYGEYVQVVTSHEISQTGADEIWKFIIRNLELLSSNKGDLFHSYITLKRHALEGLPKPKVKLQYREEENGETKLSPDLFSIPREFSYTTKFTIDYKLGSMDLKEIIAYHLKNHENLKDSSNLSVDISFDDVPLKSKVILNSLGIITVKFINCREVYPYKIFEQGKLKKISLDTLFAPIVKEFNENNIQVRFIVGDAPKRSYLLNMKNHTGYYSCQFCCIKGIYSKEFKKVTFPFNENAKPRTDLEFREIGEKVSKKHDLNESITCGIMGTTPLSKLENVNLIMHVVVDYMHNVCLGICKTILEFFFNKESRRTHRNKERIDQINKGLKCILVPSEFTRYTRDLDIGHYKASELRNVLLVYMPIIVKELDENEANVFILLSFLVKIMVVPDKYYDIIKTRYDIQRIVDKFLLDFEELSNGFHAVYNFHAFKHILNVRELGVLTESSAFCYEDYYSEVKNSYSLSAASKWKQIFQSFYLRRKYKSHQCKVKLFFNESTTSKNDDTIVFYNFNFYKICKIINENLICNKILVETYFSDIADINMSDSLIFKFNKLDRKVVTILKSNVDGKGVRVDDFIIFVPNNVLFE